MRSRVSDILAMLASGAAQADILEDYPYLDGENITAALGLAACQIDHPVLLVA